MSGGLLRGTFLFCMHTTEDPPHQKADKRIAVTECILIAP